MSQDTFVVPDDNVSAFRENFKLLVNSMGSSSSDPLPTLEKIWSWVTWIKGNNGTQDHNNHFFKVALFNLSKAMLKRRYSEDVQCQAVNVFLQDCLISSADHILKDIPEVTRLATTILHPLHNFYILYGHSPVEASGSAGADGTTPGAAGGIDADWAERVNVGDHVDFHNDAGNWVTAVVKTVSPTFTEFEVQEEGAAPMWLSIDDDRMAPLGKGGKGKSGAVSEAEAAQAEIAATEEWRFALHRGDMCDGLDTVKKWYQCVVVDEKEEEGVAYIKVDFIGWGFKFDEWVPRVSPRLAKLNSRSFGRRGTLVADHVETDQELLVENDEDDPPGVAAVKRPGVLKSRYLIDNVNHWMSTARGAARVLERMGQTEPPMPLTEMSTVVTMLARIADILAKPFAVEFVPLLFERVAARLNGLDESSLRTMSKEMVEGLMRSLRRLLRRVFTKEETGKAVERLYLGIALKCARCKQLERRLNGLTYIQHLLLMAKNAKLYPGGIQTVSWTSGGERLEQHYRVETSCWVTTDMMTAWLLENKLVQDVFVERPHVELMKRAPDLLRFLANEGQLSLELFDAVWAASRSSFHPQAVAVTLLLGELARDLSTPLLQELLKRVTEIPDAEYDANTIALLAQIAVSQPFVEPAADAKADDARAGGARCAREAVHILWNLAHGCSIAASAEPTVLEAMRTVAATALSKLQAAVFQDSALLALRVEYMAKCVDNVAAHKYVQSSLRLLRGILEAYLRGGEPAPPEQQDGESKAGDAPSPSPSPSPSSTPVSRGGWLQRLNTDHGLLDLLLRDLQTLKSEAAALVAALPASPSEDDLTALSSPSWQSSYGDEISVRLDFIAFLLSESGLCLTPAQADVMWDQCITGALTAAERAKALDWFLRACFALSKEAAGDNVDTYFTSDIAIHLFGTKMSDVEFARALTPDGFRCFEAFFTYVNSLTDKLVKDAGAATFQVMDLDLQGMDVLWSIALQARSADTVSCAVTFLTALQQRLCAALKAEIAVYRRSYVKRCMDNVAAAAAAPAADTEAVVRIERSLTLLDALLDEAEEKSRARGLKPHLPALGRKLRLLFSCNLDGPNGTTIKAKKVAITAYAQERGYDLKAAVAQLVGMKMSSLRLYVMGLQELTGPLLGRTLESIGITDGSHAMALAVKVPKAKPVAASDSKTAEEAAAIAAAIEEAAKKEAADQEARELAAPITDLPAMIIAGEPAYFGTLLSLLDKSAALALPDHVVAQVWRLVYRLPTNTAARDALWSLAAMRAAQTPSDVRSAWERVLNPSSPFSLLYGLQVVRGWFTNPTRQAADVAAVQADRVVSGAIEGRDESADADADADADAGEEEAKEAATTSMSPSWDARCTWQQDFLAQGGFQHLYECLTRADGPIAAVLAGQSGALAKEAALSVIQLVHVCVLAAMTVTSPGTDLSVLAADTGASGVVLDDLVEVLRAAPGDVAGMLAVVDWGALQHLLLGFMAYVRPSGAGGNGGDESDPVEVSVDAKDADVVSTAASLWVAACLHMPSLWSQFLAMPPPSPMGLLFSLLTCSSGDGAATVRATTARCLHTLCALMDTSATSPVMADGSRHPHAHFLTLLLRHLPKPLPEDGSPVPPGVLAAQQSPELFDLASNLLVEACNGRCGGSPALYHDTLLQMVAHIRSSVGLETRYSDVVDTTLVGVMDLTRVLVSASDSMRELVGSRREGCHDLIRFLFHDCLFALPSGAEGGSGSGSGSGSGGAMEKYSPMPSSMSATSTEPPKCKSTQARSAAFRLLGALVQGSLPNTLELDAELTELVEAFVSPSGWKYNPRISTKAADGYVGLRNLGCICYMNSLMQQFYMIKPLRYGILSAPLPSELDPEARKDDLVYQLQQLLGHLYLSERRAYNPAPWCFAYKDEYGKPTNYLVQQDAQEYFQVLCDRVENQLKGTAQAKLLQSVLMGTLGNQIVCQGGCGSLRTRLESYCCISVQVQHKKSLAESLESLIKGEQVDGVDCEACGTKQNATKRVSIDQMSNVLVFHHKRFELNYETFQRVKVNDRFEFPHKLDLYPYSTEGVAFKDKLEAKKKAKEAAAAKAAEDEEGGDGGAGAGAGAVESKTSDADADSDAEEARPYELHPKEYYEYELVGVVIHMGTAETGHYYSLIRERGDEPSEIVEATRAASAAGAGAGGPCGVDVGVEPNLVMESTAADAAQRAEAVRHGNRDRWFEFNDALVQPFEVERLPAEAFGGARAVKRWNMYLNQMVEVNEPISHNAYMLVYERTTPQEPDYQSPESASAAANPAPAAADGEGGGGDDGDDDAAKKKKKKEHGGEAGADGDGDDGDEPAVDTAAVLRDTTAPVVVDTALHPWVPPSIASQVQSDNLRFLHNLHMYAPECVEFLKTYATNLASLLPAVPVPVLPEGQPNFGLPIITHLVQLGIKVLAHSADAAAFPGFCDAVGNLLDNNVPAATALLEMCLREDDDFKDVGFRCHVSSVRSAFFGLILRALKVLEPHDTPQLMDTHIVKVTLPPPAPLDDEEDKDADADADADADVEGGVEIDVPMHDTITGRFMDRMVSPEFLDYTATAWKHFNEFFGLLLEFARMGRPQRVFLHTKDTATLLLDLYLGKDSPVYGTGKLVDPELRPREVMGSKQIKPIFTNMLAVAALLTRCCRTPAMTKFGAGMPPGAVIYMDARDEGIIDRHQEAAMRAAMAEADDPAAAADVGADGAPPPAVTKLVTTGEEELFVPPTNLIRLIIHKLLYTNALSRGDGPAAIGDIACHFSWMWPDFTAHISTLLSDGIDKADFDEVGPYFTVLETFLGLQDELLRTRLHTIMLGSEATVGVIPLMRQFADKYPHFTYECLHNTVRLMRTYDWLSDRLLQDDAAVQWFERFLRIYGGDPKNKEFKSFATAPPPLPPKAQQVEMRAMLDGPPAGLSIAAEHIIFTKLKMSEAERTRRTLAQLEALLVASGKALLGEDEINRMLAAEAEAARVAAAAAAAEASAQQAAGDGGGGGGGDDASSDDLNGSPDGGMHALDDDDDEIYGGDLD